MQRRRLIGINAPIGLIAVGTLLCTAASALADDVSATSLTPLPRKLWDADKAAHLLRRAGFGGTAEQVQALSDLGMEAAVASLVDTKPQAWENGPPPIDPLLNEPPDREELRGLSEEERQKLQQERRQAEQRTFEEVRLWWIDRMVRTPRPFEEKMTLLWHGHFTSGMREVRNPVFLYEQNQMLRKHALGPFRDLLLAVSRDRAMLVYLDNARNVQRSPNENYARELMELFTLGEGNYSEADIKALARAFTGWSLDREGFVFRARQHDYDPKKFLGQSGRFNGTEALDIILAQPACSRHLARTLLEFFVRPDPDRKLVEALAGVIRKEKYDLRPVMKTLFSSRAFYDETARGSLIKSPVELMVGAARELGAGLTALPLAERAMAGMGQALMQPPNVKGWDGGEKWINTATLFNRYNFVGGLVHGNGRPGGRGRAAAPAPSRDASDPSRDRKGAVASADGSGRAPASADDQTEMTNDEAVDLERFKGKVSTPGMEQMAVGPTSRLRRESQPPYDPKPIIDANGLSDPESLVSYYAKHLLAVPLPSAKKQQLVEYLTNSDADGAESGAGGDVGNERERRAARRRQRAEDPMDRVRTMIHLLMSTPEYQLN